MPPMTTDTNDHSPTAMIGSTHPLSHRLTKKRAAAAIEMTISMLSAGSWAFTSV
jgi:hypothetical protein